MNWKSWIKTGLIFAMTLLIVAGLAEALGVWGWVFQPYSKLTGKATIA